MERTKADPIISARRGGYEIVCRTGSRTLAAITPELPGVILLQVGPQETAGQAILWALEAARDGRLKTRKEWGF